MSFGQRRALFYLKMILILIFETYHCIAKNVYICYKVICFLDKSF